MDDKHGLYGKYVVTKADGSPVDDEAEYFVLRVDTDSNTLPALLAYAIACRRRDPKLSVDLMGLVSYHWGEADGYDDDTQELLDFIDAKIQAIESREQPAAAVYTGPTPPAFAVADATGEQSEE